MLKRRREIIHMYDATLKSFGVKVLPHFTKEHTSSGHLYMTRISGIGLKERQEAIEKLVSGEFRRMSIINRYLCTLLINDWDFG